MPALSGLRAAGERSRSGFAARTGEDREAGIFREGRIGLGELAEEELGTFGGIDEAGVKAIGAKAESRVFGGRNV
jgi:hypothetical protein